MVNIIVEFSKYLLIILMTVYTYSCFSVFRYEYEEDRQQILLRQNKLMFSIQFIAYGVMYLKTGKQEILFFYVAQVILFLAVIALYTIIYPNVSRVVINNMCMLLSIGFIMILRLDTEKAIKQFIFVGISMVLSLIVPVMIRKMKSLADWTYIYAGVGLAALALVAVFAATSGGAKLGFSIAGISIQPSEFVKISFVFFVAASLKRSTDFKNVVITTAIAAAHVLVLVASTDLGAALILFVVYLIMLYVATKQPLYLFGGMLTGSGSAVIAYQMFRHIKVRVSVWKDPFATYETGGFQVAQSLFAIGTGGWLGMGLCQGSPESIPVAAEDFIFSAIVEELGLIFGLCLILVCVSCYIMFLNIAMQLRNRFYKLVALGLGTCYIFQVFLTIGGVTKFIPSTGVTLPLVSYGGSSVLSTLIMFAIIQGLYILREDEEEIIERKKARQLRDERRREAIQKETRKRKTKKKKATNKEFARVTYLFVTLFLVLMGYIVYFNVAESEKIINSPYNTRQDTFSDRVVRGSILDKNGEVLAKTEVAEDGSELRTYPYGEIFAHVIGYDVNGKSGLESAENFDLLTSNAFFLERIIKEFKAEKNIGDSVVTTLDAKLQTAAYNALGEERGAVVAMEADTGKILAMVSKPSFDPNSVKENWDYLNADAGQSPLLNRATQGAYAPGSIFKIVTALEYIREQPNYSAYTYDCYGEITYDGTTIPCFDHTAHGFQDLNASFANSCNSSFANIGLSLNRASYAKTCKQLLFNSKLPSVLDYRKSDFSLNESSTNAEVMMTAMGQGDTQVSPYHMALITSAVANGGKLMKPYLVSEVTNYTGTPVKKNKPSVYKELMTAEESAVLTQYMTSVVTQGTGMELSGESYSVAGKTGTAEYGSAGQSHSWFVGFTNVEDPEIVVSVIVEGNEMQTGGRAIPVAKAVMNAYYYE